VALQELSQMDLPEREMVLSPILPAKGLAMIYAARGVGKTQIGIGASYAVATGGSFLRWRAVQPRRVLYIDGEMPARALQERINMLAASGEGMPSPDYFRFLPMDLQELGTSCNLANPQDQKAIEAELHGAELLVLDNLSTLVSAGRENDAESWDAMQAWLLQLRRRGVSVLMIHHAGRGENARGTSKREDVLDTVIHLRHPDDYSPEQGARFEVHLWKARGLFGADATPFEARLAVEQGKAVWTTSALRDLEVEQVLDMSQARLSVRNIATELGIGKSKVSRIQAKLKEEGRL
jgi:putative DNA primase/helicase